MITSGFLGCPSSLCYNNIQAESGLYSETVWREGKAFGYLQIVPPGRQLVWVESSYQPIGMEGEGVN